MKRELDFAGSFYIHFKETTPLNKNGNNLWLKLSFGSSEPFDIVTPFMLHMELTLRQMSEKVG